ncbi:thiamine-phosphate pyrophosphorylase [Jannaschia faecimaris]|uniref:Thiamine-phosphate pyrophosphorylase n=1 Tax=Jannaschia faecimaris TaxID=1244108 RepID=A0A1H3NVY0_9RHOB|nr:thiamine phosphate synthase [Jannaschia faecimaris]SDY92860.1 thiamine-phosphate pyrophosphorylase [Jannaschia faecimaris]
MTDMPQLYLITPPEIDAGFEGRLSSVLDSNDIACLRLDLATKDEDRITRGVDLCREVAHRYEVPLIITDHSALVEKLGLDGVHLTDPRPLRKLRTDWGPDPIIGAFCGTSRHDGMAAGEAGADYVAFGPAGPAPLGTAGRAEPELFQWWSQMIELPVVAEGALDLATIETLKDATDFIALGEEIWSTEDPVKALRDLTAPFRA